MLQELQYLLNHKRMYTVYLIIIIKSIATQHQQHNKTMVENIVRITKYETSNCDFYEYLISAHKCVAFRHLQQNNSTSRIHRKQGTPGTSKTIWRKTLFHLHKSSLYINYGFLCFFIFPKKKKCIQYSLFILDSWC